MSFYFALFSSWDPSRRNNKELSPKQIRNKNFFRDGLCPPLPHPPQNKHFLIIYFIFLICPFCWANLYSTSGGICRVYMQSKPFMGAKISVLGLILYFPPYLRSAMVWFPLINRKGLQTWHHSGSGPVQKWLRATFWRKNLCRYFISMLIEEYQMIFDTL